MINPELVLSAKILIVDDNILNVQVLRKILNEAGYLNVFFTTDSQKAFDLYKETHPDLVLLDFNMPGLNGIEVIKQLNTVDSAGYLPVLMITTEEDPALRQQAFNVGAKDFLRKPFEKSEVLARSRNLIEVRLLYNQIKVSNQGLGDEIVSRTRELQKTRLEVVHRMAKVAEYRDSHTGLHIIRMSRYAHALAKALGQGSVQCELILNTSPLHDVGKVAIPDAILLKPGKLEPNEYDVMKTHTLLGAQMLASSDSVFLKMAETIALSHHEKFDGTGYPHGLKGQDIPFVGRVAAIADVFDALSSIRPYKQAWTFDESLTELVKLKGTHFEPEMVDAFCAIKKDIKEIYNAYQDAK